MKRGGIVGLAGCWVILATGQTGWGQSPADLAETARFVANFQNPDGGFASKTGGESSLGATSSALRVLGYTAGSVRDVPGVIAYVKSCYDEASGGFAPTPGGKPDVNTTTSGLNSLDALHLDAKPYVDKAVAYFGKAALTYEEVRIAIAGLGAVKATSPDFPRWTAEVINKDRNFDGTYGIGAAQPKATGGSAAALLRMGMTLEPDPRAAIVGALRAGQHDDGGWGAGVGDDPSDLGSSYRIMRALFMLKEKPDLTKLRAYIARHKQSDGGYASTPDGTADIGGTYLCAIMNYWSRLLDGEPVCVETAGFSPLFNGKDLTGWEGNTSLWKVENEMIVGDSPGIKANQFLATEAAYEDFVLKFSVKLTGDVGNSGVMFRSVRIPGTEMSGYQADVGPGWWGGLYDESRRNRELVKGNPKAVEGLHKGDWNQITVRAMGEHVTIYLNDRTTVDYREDDSSIARDGKIALQIHAGDAMRVEFKDIYLQELPIPRPAEAVGALEPGFHIQALKPGHADGRKYVVYVPKTYDGIKSLPVILFLHGSGERGNDGVQSAQIGMGAAIAANPERFNAFVVLPQATKTWASDSDDAKAALAALDEVMAAYKIDDGKQILTGLSMGGSGTWSIAAALPDRFAAIVPICGRGNPETAAKIKHLPTWTVVGDLDSNPLASLRVIDDALRALGASVHQTEYRNVPHNSWDRGYNDPTLIEWMLGQKREVH